MVNNAYIERSIGDMSIIGYYDTLNQAIVNIIHTMNEAGERGINAARAIALALQICNARAQQHIVAGF